MQLVKKLFTALTLLLVLQCCKQNEKPNVDRDANKRMAAILDSIVENNNNIDNPFASEAQVAFFAKQAANAGNDQRRKAIATYFKGAALLKVGHEKEAVDEFASLAAIPGLMNSNLGNDVEDNFALAYLRYGERVNCNLNHTSLSCIFPIQKQGIHQDATGSNKAIELYKDILARKPGDLTSRWLLNIAYMTIGGYPQKVPANLVIPGLDKDTSGIAVKPFVDIASSLRLNTRNKAGGVVTDDFNNDGYLDIMTSEWGWKDGYMHVFINNKNGGFTDVTQQSGLEGFRGGLNMIQADYNNDGFVDVLVLRGAWNSGQYGRLPNSLLRNNGDGTFTDVTIKSGLLSFHPTQAAVWSDCNNDGWLDLFIGNETTSLTDPQSTELYINDGNGSFTEVAELAGVDVSAFIKGVTCADYDNDGLPDIFISTLNGNKMLFKNNGMQGKTIRFKNVTHDAGLDDITTKTFPTWFFDYDNDGWPDIFVCGYDPGGNSMAYDAAAQALGKPESSASTMYLYHNNHNGTFTNVTKAAGLDKNVFAMGSNFGDYDNDGYLDMYLGTGNPDYRSILPNKLYKNVNGERFVDVTTAAKVGNLQKGHGVSFVDLDNDGDQDIYEETGGAFDGDAYYNAFYMNPGQNNNRWISIQLNGSKSNRSAIGARIKLTFNDNGKQRAVYRDVNSGGSFGCSPLRREIGIGQATVIDELSITWPGSATPQVFKNIKPCQFISVTQGNNSIKQVALKVTEFKLDAKQMAECGIAIASKSNK